MKRVAVAFTGPSNSGKTTLIVQVSQYLQKQGFKVCIVKHDPKDKARFDTDGKDSDKFTKTGADVAVLSPTRTTLFKQSFATIDDIISLFGEFDYLLVEGLKTLPLPRIAVMRNSIDERYFEVSDTIATDGSIAKEEFPKDSQLLNLNNIKQIVEWINENGVKV